MRLALAALAALGLLALAALPAAAIGPVKLYDPRVSARTATTGTTIVFEVMYRNQAGEQAVAVTVTVGGRVYPMRAATDVALVRDGIRYEARVQPATGTSKVEFDVTDAKGRPASVAGGTLSIAPPPPSGGTSRPPSGGTTRPPSGGSTPAGVLPPSGQTTAADAAGPTGVFTAATPWAATVALPIRIDGGPGAPAGRQGSGPRLVTSGSAVPGYPSGLARGWDAAGPGAGRTPSVVGGAASTAAAILVAPSWSTAQAMLAVTVTTVGGTAMAMAFLVFGKRRRDGEPTADEGTLATAAASVATAPALTVVLPGDAVPPPPQVPSDAELAVPRWRRASLLEARKADPVRAPLGPVVSMTFESGTVAPLDGHEFRTIRYRVVRLLDSPDELAAQEVGILDQGDEVQLIERSGPYWLVLCPDGRRGWLHRMTLGDPAVRGEPIGAPVLQASSVWADPYAGRLGVTGATAAAVPPATADRPVPAEGAADESVDADVLEAYLRSIGRA